MEGFWGVGCWGFNLLLFMFTGKISFSRFLTLEVLSCCYPFFLLLVIFPLTQKVCQSFKKDCIVIHRRFICFSLLLQEKSYFIGMKVLR